MLCVISVIAIIHSCTVRSLQENAIGNEGVVFLAEALKTNMSLRTLWLVLHLCAIIDQYLGIQPEIKNRSQS